MFKADHTVPTAEKQRAVTILCYLERAREEKPLLLKEMASCCDCLLRKQKRLQQSIVWTSNPSHKALLSKKLTYHELDMVRMWKIVTQYVTDLPSIPIQPGGNLIPQPIADTLDVDIDVDDSDTLIDARFECGEESDDDEDDDEYVEDEQEGVELDELDNIV